MRFTRNTLFIFIGGMLIFGAGEVAVGTSGFWYLIPAIIGWLFLTHVEERANDYLENKK